MSNKMVFGAYCTACAIITWRDFRNPDKNWPLPAPPPYRYLWATVGFGLCYAIGLITDEKVAATLAVGLVFGLAFQTANSYKKGSSPNLGSSPATPSTPSSPSNQGGTPGQSPYSGTTRA